MGVHELNATASFDHALGQCPLIAILRGITPADAVEIGETLFNAGFRVIEVPLNSPQPLATIERLAKHMAGRAVIGAGTVLAVSDVDDVAAAGGTLIIAPNFNREVIARAIEHDLTVIPGVFTPTETLDALAAGATAVKLFPADMTSPNGLRALISVVPKGSRILPVGGITPESLADWHAAGAAGFGIGSALYTPGLAVETVRDRAAAFIRAAGALRPNLEARP
jgi:2-dehydro-3-deoxyphosphogalactonate aldolase